MRYASLFEPIQIGKTVVKNRIFMPPVSTNLCAKNHYISDALIEHYASRAKGGVGLIITEVTTIEPVYTYLPGDISICDDSCGTAATEGLIKQRSRSLLVQRLDGIILTNLSIFNWYQTHLKRYGRL